MSDEFQLRKDVDRLNEFVDEINRLLQENNVDGLKELLEKFYDKSDVDVVREGLSGDLERLSGDLDSLSVGLQHLSDELNGVDGEDGFVTDLIQLQESLYGGEGYSLSNPSSGSLKGLVLTLQSQLTSFDDVLNNESTGLVKGLSDLQNDLSALQSSNTDLSETLTALSIGLTNFSGTLQQFKDKLAQNGINYDDLDNGIAKLLEMIIGAKQDINTANNNITGINNTIGTTNSTSNSTVFGKINNANNNITGINNTIGTTGSTNPDTLFGKINETTNNLNDVSETALDIEKTLYKGEGSNYNPNATPQNPTQGTVLPVLDQTQTDLVNTRNIIFDSNNTLFNLDTYCKELLSPISENNKYGVIFVYVTSGDALTGEEINSFEQEVLHTRNILDFAFTSTGDSDFGKLYQEDDDGEWVLIDNYALNATKNITMQPVMGICDYRIHNKTYPASPILEMLGNIDYMYELETKKYYTLEDI